MTAVTLAPPFPLLDLPDVILFALLQSVTGRELKNLRLTCKILHFHVTPLLFRTIVLTPHEPHFKHVLEVLGQHDGGRLARYARTLRFDCRYPADVSKPCFWNRSHLHRFHYDAYVLKRNVGTGRVHLTYMLGQFSQILNGVQFPYLDQVIISGRGSKGHQNRPSESISRQSTNGKWTDDAPSFYACRFRELTGREIDADSQWTLESNPTKSQFYTTCLLLSIWATGRRVRSVVVEDEQWQGPMNSGGLPTSSDRTGRDCVASDFVSALKGMGLLSSDDMQGAGSDHEHFDQVARVEQMLTEVLVQ